MMLSEVTVTTKPNKPTHGKLSQSTCSPSSRYLTILESLSIKCRVYDRGGLSLKALSLCLASQVWFTSRVMVVRPFPFQLVLLALSSFLIDVCSVVYWWIRWQRLYPWFCWPQLTTTTSVCFGKTWNDMQSLLFMPKLWLHNNQLIATQ